MHFTQEDYIKIENWLHRNSVKDTEFQEALPFTGKEIVTVVQDGHNRKVNIQEFINQLYKHGVEDFLNVTNTYKANNITLKEAIRLIPAEARKEGQVITFLNTDGNWEIYQFIGKLNQWNNPTLWNNPFDWEKLIVNSILPDEEDLTKSAPDAKGNAYLSLKDRKYEPDKYSGLGRKILRRRVVEIEDPLYGTQEKNLLLQADFAEDNTVYVVRYDFTLNGQDIILPDNSYIEYEGGSISDGNIIDRAGGLNRVVLKKNIVNGKNILTQEMVSKSNTIYEIRYDFYLDSTEITIHEGCILDYQGGSLNDGIIFCNNTKINSNTKCFNNIILKNNSWSNVIWWGAKDNKKEDSTKAFQEASHNIKESGTLFIPAGEYFISDTIEIIDIHIKCEGKIFSDVLGEKQSVFRISKSEGGAKWLNRLNIDGLKIECSKRNELGFGNGIALDIDTYFVSVSHCDIRFYNYGYLIRGWDVTLFESLSYGCKTNIAAASRSFNNLNIIGGTHTDGYRASIYLGDPEIGFEGTYGGGRDVLISGIACDGGVIILDSVTAATISNCYLERTNTKKQLTIKGNCKNVSILNNHFNACTYGIYIDDESNVQGLVINNNYFINILGVAIHLGLLCSQVNIKYNYYHSSAKLLQKVYVPLYPKYSLTEYREVSKELFKDIEVNSWDYKSKYKVFGGNLLLKDDEVFKIQYFGAYYLDNYEIIEKTFNIENCICTPIDSDALYYYNGGDFIVVGGKLGYISSIDFENNTMTLSNHFNSIKGQYVISPSRPTLKLLYKNNIETSENNPSTDNLRKGDYLFNTNQNIPMYWDGKLWRDASGENIDTNNKYGTFSQKPASSKEGHAYFCTDRQTQEGATEGIMIYHKGNNVWVDALGRVVS